MGLDPTELLIKEPEVGDKFDAQMVIVGEGGMHTPREEVEALEEQAFAAEEEEEEDAAEGDGAEADEAGVDVSASAEVGAVGDAGTPLP